MTNDYNLDFFQAMEAWEKGAGVECTNGELCAGYLADTYDKNITFPLWIIKAKWRIVEQKCWLELEVQKQVKQINGNTCANCFESGARQLVAEAIKRIEAFSNPSSEYFQDVVKTLKEMIGEK